MDWASQAFDALSDEVMLPPIAPGKNRPVYLLGHLIVVHDAMIPQLRLGEGLYGHLRPAFVDNPDGAVAEIPAVSELRENWRELNLRLSSALAQLSAAQWLERHATVSEEDFSKEPHRNRLAILLSRLNHAAYHLGQLRLMSK
jgi:uncharacterized damage-inducible protein DinB